MGQNEIFGMREKCRFLKLMHMASCSCILLWHEYIFILRFVWFITYLWYHFGTVDFDAELEEEEAEPEEAASPEY